MAEETVTVPADSKEEVPAASTSAEQTDGEDVDIEAKRLMGVGSRNLVMKDIRSAVNAFQEASSLLGKKYGETADQCADAFYYYGVALLELARMENGVLGNALEGMPEDEGDDGEEDPNIPSASDLAENERQQLREQVYDAMAEKEEKSGNESEDKETKEQSAEVKDEKSEEKANGKDKETGDVEMEAPESMDTEKTNEESSEKEAEAGKTEKEAEAGKTEKEAEAGKTEKEAEAGKTEKEAEAGKTEKEAEAGKTEAEAEAGKTEASSEAEMKEADVSKDATGKPEEKEADSTQDSENKAADSTQDAESKPTDSAQDAKKKTADSTQDSETKPADSTQDSEKKPADDTEEPKDAPEPAAKTAKSAAKEPAKENEAEGDEAMEGEEEEESESDENEGTEEKENEEEVDNLQLAWEMLDLSKIIFKRKTDKDSQLKAAQAHLRLGEVSVESENYSQAVEDFLACLNIQKEHLEEHDRLLAETHYQLGLAYQFSTKHEEAISHYTHSISVIEKRMAVLTEKATESSDEIKKEMDELNGLLPDIKEKIEDSKEAQKTADVTDKALKETLAGGSSEFPKENGGTSTSAAAEQTKDCTVPVTNCISHLVRKKRKPEEESPLKEAKKAKPEPVENGAGTGDAVVPTNEEVEKVEEEEKQTPMETAAVESTA